jgi:predicted nucleotide-binding protein (sugar kinase/HSP70/actin superfamily)
MNKIKIGIPRAGLYYKYGKLWETFFNELGCQTILSPETNKEILTNGINYSIDENCLSFKIYMGHINYLKDKVDYVLVPRIVNFGKNEDVCVKFNALYDIVKNTFNNIKIINYNVDIKKGEGELSAFLKMGKTIHKSYVASLKAYIKGKYRQRKYNKLLYRRQENNIKNNNQPKILIISHGYNIHDKLIGYPLIKYLRKLNVLPLYSDIVINKAIKKRSQKISKSLYWTYNKELIGTIDYYKNIIDGLIFVSTFPCGPDSLVNELCIRKIKDIPKTVIIIDELEGEAGLHTRLESFIDIIKNKKGLV